MRELSIFVDESGDFGTYKTHSPYYLFTLVFHNQSFPITSQIYHLESNLTNINLNPSHCFHVGPIIRREEDYIHMSVPERRRCLNYLVSFTRNAEISYKTFSAEKKHMKDALQLTVNLTKQLSQFIRDNYNFFLNFDRIILYYDNGQVELGKLLASVFTLLIPQIEFRKVLPAEYRLFQVADLICTMELILLKAQNNLLSKSELNFFGSMRDMNKNYIKPIKAKRFHVVSS